MLQMFFMKACCLFLSLLGCSWKLYKSVDVFCCLFLEAETRLVGDRDEDQRLPRLRTRDHSRDHPRLHMFHRRKVHTAAEMVSLSGWERMSTPWPVKRGGGWTPPSVPPSDLGNTRRLATSMVPREPCVDGSPIRFAVLMATLASCPGTGSTWCTWKMSWGRRFPTGTGPNTGECHPSGGISRDPSSSLREAVVCLADVQGILSPAATLDIGSGRHDWRTKSVMLSGRKHLRLSLTGFHNRTMLCIMTWVATCYLMIYLPTTPCSTFTTPMSTMSLPSGRSSNFSGATQHTTTTCLVDVGASHVHLLRSPTDEWTRSQWPWGTTEE